jgi:YesN/AraC family two-component response regulator
VTRQASLTLLGEAPTGKLALQLAQELTPDLVLVDIHLPDMNGIEVTQRMLCALPAVKIVIFSGETNRLNDFFYHKYRVCWLNGTVWAKKF